MGNSLRGRVQGDVSSQDMDNSLNIKKLLKGNPAADPEKVQEAIQQLRDLEIAGVPVDPGYRLTSPFSIASPTSRSQGSSGLPGKKTQLTHR